MHAGHFGPHPTGTAGGIQAGVATTHAGKVWLVFNALGAIAFAFSFSFILVSPGLRVGAADRYLWCGSPAPDSGHVCCCVAHMLPCIHASSAGRLHCCSSLECACTARLACAPVKRGSGGAVSAHSSKCRLAASQSNRSYSTLQPVTFLSLATAAQAGLPSAVWVLTELSDWKAAVAYSCACCLQVEIQDTIKPLPGNSEAKQMKKASRFSITATTMFCEALPC